MGSYKNIYRNNPESLFQHDYDLLKTKSPQNHLPVVFGRTLDSLLQQLLDYFIRDYIYYYFKEYAYKPELSRDNIK